MGYDNCVMAHCSGIDFSCYVFSIASVWTVVERDV